MDNLTIEQYKQEMLRQASRARAFDPPAAVPLEESSFQQHEFGEPDLPSIVHIPANEIMEDTYIQPDPFFDTTIEAEDIIPFVQEHDGNNNVFFTAEAQPPEPEFKTQTEAIIDVPPSLPQAVPQAVPNAGVISDEEWFGSCPAITAPENICTEPEEVCAEQLDNIEHFPPCNTCTACNANQANNAELENADKTTEYYEMPSPVFTSLAEFRANNPAKGELIIHVVDNFGSPAAGARVQITRQVGGRTYRFYDGYAGRNGSVGPIELPAPSKETAFHETTVPYALYDITVTHARDRQQLQNVPMFANTVGEQVVRMQNSIPINEAVYVK